MSSTLAEQQQADPRRPRPPLADERTTLISFLQWHRLTLEHKCRGLTVDQLARRSVERSALSLLGLVRHCADGERFWFRHVMAGQYAPPLFAAAFDFSDATDDTADEAWQAWRTEIAFAESLVAEAADLDVIGQEPGAGPVSLRWVLMHMIEEYARHNGHADLLREQVDGSVGL